MTGSEVEFHGNNLMDDITLQDSRNIKDKIKNNNAALLQQLMKSNLDSSIILINRIIETIESENITDTKVITESYYLMGIYYYMIRKYSESVKYLQISADLKENAKEFDEQFAKTLYNISVAYNGLGDFSEMEEYSLKSLEVMKRIFGESSPKLLGSYSNLIIVNMELQEYEKSLTYATTALKIADNNTELLNSGILADLYSNMGVIYMFLADYSKAKIYLEKSESIYQNKHLSLIDNYFNLMNSLAITYDALNLPEKSTEYYEKGLALALSNNSQLAYNNIKNYASILGNRGYERKGESLLLQSIGRAKNKFGDDSPVYIEVLNNYAEYLREYKINNVKSLKYYRMCIDYLEKNSQNKSFYDDVKLGYSLSLADGGYMEEALKTIQSLLFYEAGDLNENEHGPYENPDVVNFKADKKSLKALRGKYKILWMIYNKSNDQKSLIAASETAELIIEVLEKVRINISEDESRLILGDRFRDTYLNAIRDFNLLYSETGDRHFLEKAFEFSEKSKVAGLLTSTRELKAAQFNIPADIADFEKKLQRNIILLNARITEENSEENPNLELLQEWKDNILKNTRQRDSLILIIEDRYPDYYLFKYNTRVANLKEIPDIIGFNGNYINYVISDSLLYIFVANRKNQQLLAIPVDSSFFNNIKSFRTLLSLPSPLSNARIAFDNFQSTGYSIYKTIIEPVIPYLISDKIIISPDNILSYLPFETIPTSPVSGDKILYNKIGYLMNDFDISYTYSATFMAESSKRKYSSGTKTIVFAPSYLESIDIQSVMKNRQVTNTKLADLPYARQEAEYVTEITNGKLYINYKAIESVYKSESGKYDIIHLAMHTILDDRDPMNSTLIFSSGNDTLDDHYLKTYEVYGIPLKAKMVVLSSCNTGAGLLYSGEGILSLARGFMYSGSESVVMAMWEIDDKSGTEIVKSFYDNLKKGLSKSHALKKARIDFLKKADQLRSHPYFWSALVIYGHNDPLYYSKFKIISAILLAFICAGLLAYFWKRKYS